MQLVTSRLSMKLFLRNRLDPFYYDVRETRQSEAEARFSGENLAPTFLWFDTLDRRRVLVGRAHVQAMHVHMAPPEHPARREYFEGGVIMWLAGREQPVQLAAEALDVANLLIDLDLSPKIDAFVKVTDVDGAMLTVRVEDIVCVEALIDEIDDGMEEMAEQLSVSHR